MSTMSNGSNEDLKKLIEETFGKYPFNFKTPESDVSFNLQRPDPDKPGNWLVTQHFVGGPVVNPWARRTERTPPKYISMSEDKILDANAAHKAQWTINKMDTIGVLPGGRQSQRSRTTQRIIRKKGSLARLRLLMHLDENPGQLPDMV